MAKKKTKKKKGSILKEIKPLETPNDDAMPARERTKMKKFLRTHFMASYIDGRLAKANSVKEESNILRALKLEMDQDLEHRQTEIEEYYQQIDSDYKKIGRPKSVFNERELIYLCAIQCTLKEVAGFFQVTEDTLRRRIKKEYAMSWEEFYELNSQGAKVALRRRQIRAAMDGDTQMLKFLGKNLLGQKDKVDFDGEVKVNSWVDLVNNLEKEENEKNKESKK